MTPALARFLYFAAQEIRGERVRSILRELLETERWSAEQLRALHWDRLRSLVRYAWEYVPYYRRVWSALDFSPEDLRTKEDWDLLPCLTKDDLRTCSEELRSRRSKPGLVAATSGSSGQPVAVDRCHRSWAYAHAGVIRSWRWHGVDAGDRYAYFWGQPLDPKAARIARFKDIIFNRERLNAFRVDASSSAQFYHRLQRSRARYAFGYPSALCAFAREIETARLDGRALDWRVIVTSAERLHDHQRDLLTHIFGCPVVDSYGCAEVGLAGFECEYHRMHIPVESVRVDTMSFGHEATTEILLTDLMNRNQPLLRYRVGDLIEAPVSYRVSAPESPQDSFRRLPSPTGLDQAPRSKSQPSGADASKTSEEGCPCGRDLPVMGRILGRAGDVLVLPDGRKVNANLPSYIFKKYAQERAISEYQFVQFPEGRVELRFIAGPAWVDSKGAALSADVRQVLGLEVQIRRVSRIERRGRAKHRDFVQASELERPDAEE